MPRFYDSVDKIVGYLSVVAKQPFQYKKIMFKPPRELYISQLFFRDFICPPRCGACCPRFTFDYFPGSRRLEARFQVDREWLEKRCIRLNREEVEIWSDFQARESGFFCHYLDQEIGRCKIHGKQPFSCDFELRTLFSIRDRGFLIERMFPRAWNMRNVRGRKGTFCSWKRKNRVAIDKDIQLLKELEEIAGLFSLPIWLDEITRRLEIDLDSIARGFALKNKIRIH